MKSFTFIFVLYGVETSIFTHYNVDGSWHLAKSSCETLGERLAVLDTPEKRTALQEQVHLTGYYWIGFYDPDENGNFIWLNGNPLPDSNEIWWDGDFDLGGDYCGYVTSSAEFGDFPCDQTLHFICERNFDVAENMVEEENSFELRKSGIYNLEARNMGIKSDELISLQVQSKIKCGAECVKRNCEGFSFHQETPDVGNCNITVTGSVTQHRLEGARYYIKP